MSFPASAGDRCIATDDVQVVKFSGAKGLQALRADWENLTQSLSSPRFFHLYGWYNSYLETLDPDPDSVHFFAFFRNGSIAGIFPLKAITRRLCGIRLRWLEVPRHFHMDLSDVIFERTAENASLLRVLLSYLGRCQNLAWDVLSLSRLLEDSAAAFALDVAPPPQLTSSLRCRSGYIPCHVSPEVMRARLPGSFRRNMRRLEQRARQSGTLEYRSYRRADELPQAFSRFLQVEASGWKGSTGQGTAIACHPPLRAFYDRLIENYSLHQQCVINLLWLNEICVAAQFCLVVNRVLNILKIGYCEAYSHLAPGHLLMERVLEDCSRHGTVQAISLVTDPSWSHLWRPETQAVWDHKVFNNTWRARAVYKVWAAYTKRRGPTSQLMNLAREGPPHANPQRGD